MRTSYCLSAGCAAMGSRDGHPECSALDTVYPHGTCPFFKTRERAKTDRDEVFERIKDAGIFAKDGTYIQRFTKARRIEDETGKAKTEIYPDIVAWMEWLKDREILSNEFVENYKMKHNIECV